MPKTKPVNAANLIAQDPKLIKFLRKIKNGNYNVDTKRIRYDIANMHKVRLTRSLKTRQIIQKYQVKFIDAAVQSTAFRSSIVEKKMICFDVLAELDEYLSILKKYLKSTYSDAMKANYTTQADRDALVDTFLEDSIRQKKQLETTIAYADIVLADIDAAGWRMRDISEAMELAQNKRSAV